MKYGRGFLIVAIFLSVVIAITCSFVSVKWTINKYKQTQREIHQKNILPNNSPIAVSGAKISGFWANMTWDDTIGMSVLIGGLSAITGFAVIWFLCMMILKISQRHGRKSFSPYQNHNTQGRTVKVRPTREKAQV